MMLIDTCVLVVAVSLFTSAVSLQTCYYPDGKNATALIPCNADADVSHCCRDTDLCLTNGMCFSSGLAYIVRRGCTDRTWKSPDCPNACNIDGFRSGDAALTPCGLYNDFCCGQDEAARNCCNNSGNETLAAQIAGGNVMDQADPSSTLSSSGVGPSSSATSLTPSGSTTTSASSSSLMTQRNALIGTTAAFAVLMLMAVVLAILWRRRLKKEEQEKLNKERERQRLQRERDALDQSNQRLVQEKHNIERIIAELPGPVRTQLDAARRNLGSG
ncbi:hypothetical protein ACN47E_006688 [Coniothyrium glycines]